MESKTFMELAIDRYSVRRFSRRRVERETIEAILAAGNVAPTACNRQPQRILVIDDEAALKKLRRCTMSHFDCTLAMLVCYDADECWVRDYDGKNSGDVDAAIVTTHLMLAAEELGIGSTWVMHFIPKAIIEEFELPESYVAVSLLVIGYPAEDAAPYPAHASKKPLEKTVFFNSFSC